MVEKAMFTHHRQVFPNKKLGFSTICKPPPPFHTLTVKFQFIEQFDFMVVGEGLDPPSS